MNDLQPLPPPQTLPVPIFTIPSENLSIPTTTEAILNPIITNQAIEFLTDANTQTVVVISNSLTATLGGSDGVTSSSIQSEPAKVIQQPLEQRQANPKRNNAADLSLETTFICVIAAMIGFVI